MAQSGVYSTVRTRISVLIAVAGVATMLIVSLLASKALADGREFNGTVLSKNAATKTFKMKTNGGKQIRIKVNGKTEFDDIPGRFRGLHRGLSVEVEAVRSGGRWVAEEVERNGDDGNGDDDD